MYTTPVFGGFRAQVGYGQKSGAGEVTEASLWYAGKFMGDLQAAIGWSDERLQTPPTATAAEGPSNETFGGSIAWLHTSGFNVSLAYTQMTIGGSSGLCSATTCGAGIGATTQRDDVKYYWGKVGYKFGQHAIGVDYGMNENQAAQGDEAKTYGIGYVYNPVGWLEFFAGYRIYQMERSEAILTANGQPGLGIEDITVGQVGTRIRF
jgi:hypothetical protein